MQWSLFLLILMVQCSFFACHHHEYHFIEKPMSWNDARNHCRQMYTDMPTVNDMTDINRLSGLMNTDEAWIGLYSNPGKANRQWHWSLPGVEFNETEWDQNEPDDRGNGENCAVVINNKWHDFSCERERRFICYNETGKRFNFINQRMTWPKAQKYCREHHTDLVSGLGQLREEEFEREIETSLRFFPLEKKIWIGLFRDTWRWSDSSNSSFRNWRSDKFDNGKNEKCAVLYKSGDWRPASCTEEKSFFCYDDKMILIKETKTWAEALNHCREHYHDLVSITNPHQQSLVQAKARNADTAYVWVGLLYSCPLDLWFWVNDELLCHENFAPKGKSESCSTSVAVEKESTHKWFSKKNTETFNFICALQ